MRVQFNLLLDRRFDDGCFGVFIVVDDEALVKLFEGFRFLQRKICWTVLDPAWRLHLCRRAPRPLRCVHGANGHAPLRRHTLRCLAIQMLR